MKIIDSTATQVNFFYFFNYFFNTLPPSSLSRSLILSLSLSLSLWSSLSLSPVGLWRIVYGGNYSHISIDCATTCCSLNCKCLTRRVMNGGKAANIDIYIDMGRGGKGCEF